MPLLQLFKAFPELRSRPHALLRRRGLYPAPFNAQVLWPDAGALTSPPAIVVFCCICSLPLPTSWPLNHSPRAIAPMTASLCFMRIVFAGIVVHVNFITPTKVVFKSVNLVPCLYGALLEGFLPFRVRLPHSLHVWRPCLRFCHVHVLFRYLLIFFSKRVTNKDFLS